VGTLRRASPKSEEPPCVTVSSAISLELPSNRPEIPTAHCQENSKQQFSQSSPLSFQACSVLQWHHMGIRRASLIYTCVCEQWRRVELEEHERVEMRGRGFVLRVAKHLSPSWGCYDYLVEIATLSTQTKLSMANDPWTGIDSCRKCRQCSLHPEWIQYLNSIDFLPHTYHHQTDVILLAVCCFQARTLSAGRFCCLHNVSVSERLGLLLLQLNGERLWCSRSGVTTH